MDVETACAEFLRYCRDERHLAANTLAAYKQDLTEFGRFFSGRDIVEIAGSELVDYVQHLSAQRGQAPATVKRRLACVRTMVARLTRQRVIGTNPFGSIELSVRIPARLPRCLGTAEMRALLRAAECACPTTRIAALLMFTTGMRVSELAAVRVGDIDFDQRSIRIVGKGSRERRVFIADDSIIAMVRSYIGTRHPSNAALSRLLLNARGRPATASCLRARIRMLAVRAGLNRTVTPHMLRHTAATSLLEAGVDIRFVQRLLGHHSISTTQIYTHVSDPALKAAVVGANVYRAITLSEPTMLP